MKRLFTTQITLHPISIILATFLLLTSSAIAAENAQNKQRIVSAGGSVTEILYALGLADQIVATDTSSLYPHSATQLPKVGYYRQLSTEGVLSTQATSIFAAAGAGPESVLSQLQRIGVTTHLFKQEKTLEGLYSLIEEVGLHANRQAQADALLLTIKQGINQHKGAASKQTLRPVFLMSANERGLMAAGSNTVPNLIMDIAGTSNPFAAIEGYKPVSVETFFSIKPTHVFLPAHQSGGRIAAEICELPVLSKWASMQGCQVHIVDSLLFLGMTPRLPEAVAKFVELSNLDRAKSSVD